MNTIEPIIRLTLTYYNTAKEVWDELKERFSTVNGLTIQQLKSDLADCKQQGMTIGEYYGKLKILWDELGNYEQMIGCTCESCKCEISKRLQNQRDEERVHQFLMGPDHIGQRREGGGNLLPAGIEPGQMQWRNELSANRTPPPSAAHSPFY